MRHFLAGLAVVVFVVGEFVPASAEPLDMSNALVPRLRRGVAAMPPAVRGGYVFRDSAFTARVAADGTVKFEGRAAPIWLGPLVFVFRFDLTEAIMRARGEDPYRYWKQKFLDLTFNERLAMARAARQRWLQRELRELPMRLLAQWRDTSVPTSERRRRLFETWRDVNEEIPTSATFRRILEKFVRLILPRGSPDGFHDAELATFNQDLSRPFDPYRIGIGAPRGRTRLAGMSRNGTDVPSRK